MNMKRIILITIFLASQVLFGQNIRYVVIGQASSVDSNTCLLIKAKSINKKFTQQIQKHKDVTRIKLQGFENETSEIDSVIQALGVLSEVHTIYFENCDLNQMEASWKNFKKLKSVYVLNECEFSESLLFPLFKENKITSVYLTKTDLEFEFDSLILLKDLSTVAVSDESGFKKNNLVQKLKLQNNDQIRYITVNYCGNFFKPNFSGVKEGKKIEDLIVSSPQVDYTFSSNMKCVRQPIPGIKINDTLYEIDSEKPRILTYYSGSTISFDKNAFITSEGNVYNGQVKVFYREFRNPVEIMLSGIPMTNMENSEQKLFKSGGMYEINALDDKGNQLQTVSDTSVKINFSMTDTSSAFKFYSLNDNGTWSTKTNSVTTQASFSRQQREKTATKAITEYFKFIYDNRVSVPDTTKFDDRFKSLDYITCMRRDNFNSDSKINKDSLRPYLITNYYNHGKSKQYGSIRVNYLTTTKDKQIVFEINATKYIDNMPKYLKNLIGKKYLYTGNLTKTEFKKYFNRKMTFWDVRAEANGDELTLILKSLNKFANLTCQIINLHSDKTYDVYSKMPVALVKRINVMIHREERKFNKKDRFSPDNHNNLRFVTNSNKEIFAFEYCKKFQIKNEKPMNFDEWKKYVLPFRKLFSNNFYDHDDVVSQALLKSDMGVKNIDCYIHSGQMEDVFVFYKNLPDSTEDLEYNFVLYKSINTSYPCRSTKDGYSGYYYKNHDNYLVRVFDGKIMQVTKPLELNQSKNGQKIERPYRQQYNVVDLNSNDITKLILN